MKTRLIALVAIVFTLGVVTPDVVDAQGSSNCWFCECVSNCSCKRGGDGITCVASGSGCTVSGECGVTRMEPMMPGGTLASTRSTTDASKLGIMTSLVSLSQPLTEAGRVRESWLVLANGVMVRRDCDGVILSRRVIPSVAESMRRKSVQITL